jgi:hypothetical protein
VNAKIAGDVPFGTDFWKTLYDHSPELVSVSPIYLASLVQQCRPATKIASVPVPNVPSAKAKEGSTPTRAPFTVKVSPSASSVELRQAAGQRSAATPLTVEELNCQLHAALEPIAARIERLEKTRQEKRAEQTNALFEDARSIVLNIISNFLYDLMKGGRSI